MLQYKLPNIDFRFEPIDMPNFNIGIEDNIFIGNPRSGGGGQTSIVNPLKPHPIEKVKLIEPKKEPEAQYTSGNELFYVNGSSYKGYYHSMENGPTMTGKSHSESSVNLYTQNELQKIGVVNGSEASVSQIERQLSKGPAEFEKRYPDLLDTVFKEMENGDYWLSFKEREEYSGVEVTDSINDIPSFRAHIKWLLSPAKNKQDVELRDVRKMGNWSVYTGDALKNVSNLRKKKGGDVIIPLTTSESKPATKLTLLSNDKPKAKPNNNTKPNNNKSGGIFERLIGRVREPIRGIYNEK
jgi:hypothetical protein